MDFRANTLAVLIDSELATGAREVATALHIVLERYFPKWEDERVADLFARLADRIKLTSPFMEIKSVVVQALEAHDEFWERE